MNPIKKYLKDKNIRVQDFANKCGVTNIYLYAVLRDVRRPSVSLISKIVEYSGGCLTADELIRHYTTSIKVPLI